jgi:hypothetical protein
MNNIHRSHNFFYNDSEIVFQSARRDWDDIKTEYCYWSLIASFATTFIFFFCLIKQIYNPNLLFFAAIFGTFAIALGTILWTLYLFYGKIYFEITPDGLNYHWKVLFITRNYSIPIEDIQYFCVKHLYSRQGTINSNSLIVRTSDATLTLLIYNRYEYIEETAKQLNTLLKKIIESNNNIKGIECIFIGEMSENKDADVLEKQGIKCTFPNHQLFWEQSKISSWTFISNQEELQFTIIRKGQSDWLSFFDTTIMGSVLIAMLWFFVGRFFEDPQKYHITTLIVSPILLAIVMIIPLLLLSLMGHFYKEQWTFSPDSVTNKINLFFFETTEAYKLTDSGQFFLKKEDQNFYIFFPFYSIFQLSFLHENLYPWSLQIVNSNSTKVIKISMLSKADGCWIASCINSMFIHNP